MSGNWRGLGRNVVEAGVGVRVGVGVGQLRPVGVKGVWLEPVIFADSVHVCNLLFAFVYASRKARENHSSVVLRHRLYALHVGPSRSGMGVYVFETRNKLAKQTLRNRYSR